MASIELPAPSASSGAAALSADPAVAFVELDRSRTIGATPSDPRYAEQWSLPRIGWNVVHDGAAPTGHATVAVLDTGVDTEHADLRGVVVPGVSFVDGTPADADPNGHGTWMAGIVAARTDDGIGIAGIGYAGVSVLPVTVLGTDGTGRDSDIVAGVVYAVDAGADVILMSFSATGSSAALQAAIDYAWAHDVVVVAATGNGGSSAPTYPAGDRGVIGVSSTDRSDHLAPGSNDGSDTFLAAPGVDILTTSADGGYETVSGTSAAAAEVAGAAGLMRAHDPSASNGVIVARLARDAAPAGTTVETGNGRLDLARAVADRSSEPVTPLGVAGSGGGPFVGPYVAATVRTWTGGGADNNWTTAANWGGTAPVAGDDLVFPGGAARLSNTNNYAAATAFNSITISGTGYTLAGNQVALGAGGLTESAVGASNTVNLPFAVAAVQPVTVTDGGASLLLGGVISGVGGLTTSGSGTLILSATNTFSGALTVGSGTVLARANAAFGTSVGTTTVSSGATVGVDGTGLTIAEPMTLNGSGVGGLGALRNLANNNTVSGALTLASASTIASTAGTLTLSGATANGGFLLTVSGAGNVTKSAGVVSGTGGLTQTLTGTLTLSVANTYSGATAVSAGTLKLGVANAVGANSAVTLSGGTTLDMAGFADTVASIAGGGSITNSSATAATLTAGGSNASTTFSGVIANGTGAVALTKTGSGTLTLAAADTYTGATTVSAGTIALGATNGIGASSAVTVAGGATLDLAGYSDTIGSLAGAGGVTSSAAGAVTLTAGGNNTTTTYSGVLASGSGTVSLTKSGTGTLTLSGVNTYTGSTTIGAGTIAIAADSGLGTAPAVPTPGQLVFNGGTLNTTATLSLDPDRGIALTGAGTLNTNAGTTLTVGGIVAGTGNLTASGTGTIVLPATNTYSGTTTVSAGVVRVQNATSLGTTAGGTSVASGAAIEIDGTGLVIAEPVTSLIGTGVGGAGAIHNLANDNTWSGAIALGAGGARVNSDGGTLTLSGGVTGNTRPLTVGGTGNTLISGVIATTTGTLTKDGSGTLTLAAADTYTGATTVSAGVVRVQNSGSLGAGGGSTTVAAGAAIEIDGTGLTLAESATISGTGIAGTGAIRNLANDNTWSGAITLGAGGARVNSDGGTLTLGGNIGGNTQPLTVGGAGNTLIGGVIGTTTGTLTKDGAGTLTLAAANTYRGATTVSAGTIALGATNGIGASSAVTVAGGATLDLAGYSDTIGSLAGVGLVTSSAPGAVTLTAGGDNTSTTFSGVLSSGSGAVSLAKAGSGTLDLSSATVSISGLTIAKGSLVGPISSPLVLTGDWTNNASTGAFVAGTGTVTLSGPTGQAVGGTFATTFYDLAIADPVGVSLGNDITISDVLTLGGGIVTTGPHVVTVATGGSLSLTSGWVAGNLRKSVPLGASSTVYEIGDATTYTPLTVTFPSVTTAGTLTVSTTAGDHPALAASTIDPTMSVNRYWTLTNGGIAFTTYDATFTYAASDLDAGADTTGFTVEDYAAATWSPVATTNRTSTSTKATGLSGFGDFAIGDPTSAALDHFVVSAPPAAVALSPFDVTVTAVDVAGNPVSSYAGTITFSTSDPYGAFAPASYTFLTADHGSRTFTGVATLRTAGTQTVGVADGATSGVSGSIAVASGPFAGVLILVPGETASPGSPTGVSGAATPQDANIPFTVTVVAVDGASNPVPATDTVTITSSDGAAGLPPDAALVGGSQTFAVNLRTPGSWTVTASDATEGTKTASTSPAIPVVNTPPTAVADAYTVAQDNTLVVPAGGVLANDTDPNSQALTVGTPRPVSGPADGALTLDADGSFTYTPDAGFSGTDSFTYVANDGFADSAPATVTITVTPSAFVPASDWTTNFRANRYLSLTFPAYVPPGATVTGATFTHTYRSDTPGDTTCYYFRVYDGATLLATHGSAASPVSCNSSTSWLTDVISLPEIDTDSAANDVTIVMYVRNSGGNRSQHKAAILAVDYYRD